MDLHAIAHYRREGYLVVPGVLDPGHVEECLAALTDLATDPALEAGRRGGRGAFIALEPGADASAAPRADLIRKFGDFTDGAPALLGAAMSVRLLKLNVWPDHIQPGRPDQNGRHERMHRVLQEDTATPPAVTVPAQQARMDSWRADYNSYRPHEALGQRCPATLYMPSVRAYPGTIAEWDYPADHHTRRVIGDGHIRWRDGTVYLSGALRGETVALARRDDGDWAVRFRGFDLAVLLDESNRLRCCGLDRTAVRRAA